MNKYIIPAVIALVVSGVVGLFSGGSNQSNQNLELQGLSERDVQAVSLKVGSSGTKVTKVITGTCNAATTELPLEATSTDNFTCTVTGAASGDKVFVSLPSSSGSFLGGFGISHTAASANTITFGIMNNTGAATSSFILATTSVQYVVTDN